MAQNLDRNDEHVALYVDNKQSARYCWTICSSHPGAISRPDEVGEYVKAIGKAWTYGVYKCISEWDETTKKGLCIIINISLRAKMRAGTLKNQFFETILHGAEVYPLAHQSSEEIFWCKIGKLNNVDYLCMNGLWSSKTASTYVMPDKIANIARHDLWHPWQRSMISTSKDGDYDGREVNVIIDKVGGSGKSTVGIYLACNGTGHRVPLMQSAHDIMQFVHSLDAAPCYIFDIPRDLNGMAASHMYSAIEEIKNGVTYDKRYRGRIRYMNPPKVWCFTNNVPDVGRLTIDRWKFWQIGEESLALEPLDLSGAEVEPKPKRGRRK